MATTVTLKPNAIDLSGSTSGTTTLQATAVAGTTTITLPAATDTLVGKATTDTLTNKTLTSPTLTTPVLGTPSSGTLTNCTGLPNAGLVNSSITIGGTAIALGASSSTITNDITINTVVVGKGGGNDATSVCVGSSTLPSGNTGTDNNAFGVGTLLANTTGSFGSGFGRAALRFNTSGNYNTAFGANALLSNTTASNNTAVGYQAGYSVTTSASSVYIGYQAGYSQTNNATGTNCFVGYQAGYNTTGGANTFVGPNGTGAAITTGSKNTVLGGYSGNQGGLDIRTSSNYIVLSDGDGNPRGYFDNSGVLNVGNTINAGSTTATVGLGVFSNYGSRIVDFSRYADDGAIVGFKRGATNVGTISVTASATAYNTSSDYRLKENIAPMTGALAKVAQLKPVTYKWKADGSDGEGFIAHELQEVVAGCVTGEKDALDKDGNPEYQGIDTSFLVATLTAALQELKTIVDTQAAEIAELKAKVA
jgi:hypothetical protein